MNTNSYFRLLRLHQPTGIWLLLLPGWWALVLSGRELLPTMWYMLLFAVGAVVMRGAGCIVNDMADREFDRQVERTRLRPLASGELSMRQAFMVLGVLLSIASLIALQMNRTTWVLALSSLLLVTAYPFMKRITWWPQAFLGLTFNWGALMGWTALRGHMEWPAVLLYAGGVFWTLGYDTLYAHQDKADDVQAGVKSSALRLGEQTRPMVALFYALALCFWSGAVAWEHGPLLILTFIPAALHALWQVQRVELNNPASCMATFRSNTVLGWLVLLAVAVGVLLSS